MAFAPAKFVREVRAEAAKVTWPGRKETFVTTLLVLAMAAITAIFFFAIDMGAGALVRLMFVNSGAN